MFYLIVGILLTLYYIWLAPKTIKNTMNMVLLVGLVALLLVVGTLGVIKFIQSPPEIFIGLIMTIFGVLVLKDVVQLEAKDKN